MCIQCVLQTEGRCKDRNFNEVSERETVMLHERLPSYGWSSLIASEFWHSSAMAPVIVITPRKVILIIDGDMVQASFEFLVCEFIHFKFNEFSIEKYAVLLLICIWYQLHMVQCRLHTIKKLF